VTSSDAAQLSPLLAGALALLADGATPRELEARFEAAGGALREGIADALLSDLTALGLARRARDQQGEPMYVVTSIGRKRARATTIGVDEAEQLRELERLRTDLLSTIAHELRTPLTAVRTSVGLLLDAEHAPDESQRKELLETIERNAVRMQRLVGDILDLARFRAGRLNLQLRRLDARELADAALASVRPLAEAAGQVFVVDLPRSPVWVFGDRRRLEQALVNLLSNAQRFSPDGDEIRLAVKARGGEVAWTVTDRGPGIEPADQERLFERFFVGDTQRPGATGGVGLGLPTTLAIAQAHGGRVNVASRPGKGSAFEIVVPAAGPEGVEP
jgi:signal transduction histidine kinase